MALRFVEERLTNEFAERFNIGKEHDQLTVDQLWTLMKLCRYSGKYARNGRARENLFRRLFPYADFQTIWKEKPDGESYPGLRITVDGETSEVFDD